MTNKQQRYCLSRTFKMHHGVELTDAQLDDIQDISHDMRRQSIFNVGMYRFINFALSLFAIIVWFFVPDESMKWFFLWAWIVFAVYNLWHCGVNYIEYKMFKIPSRDSDGGVDD